MWTFWERGSVLEGMEHDDAGAGIRFPLTDAQAEKWLGSRYSAQASLAFVEAGEPVPDRLDVAVFVQVAIHFLERLYRGLQSGVGVQHERVAHAAQFLLGHERRLAADDQVDELRARDLFGDLADVLGGARPFHEADVSAGFQVTVGTVDRFVDAFLAVDWRSA